MTSSALNALSLESPIVRALIFYEALLVLKMLAMSALTGRQRYRNNAFANPEDAKVKKTKVQANENVERVRRAHQNDLENILVFFVSSWLYLMTNPNEYVAINLFRAFTVARYMHTFVYAVVVIPQPSRAIAFFVGYFITAYMTVIALLHFM